MMGTALHFLGLLLIGILALFLVLCLVIVCLPMRVQVRRHVEGPPLRLRLSIGPLHVTKRLGRPTGEKKKRTDRLQTRKNKQEPKKQRVPWADWKRLRLDDVLDVAFRLMDDLIGALTVERLHVTVIVHRRDAAETGELLGATSALTGLLYPELERRFVLKDTQIVLDADFDAQQTIWGIDICVLTRMIRYPRVFWNNRHGLWNLWKTVRLSPEERKSMTQEQHEKAKE